MTGLSEAELYDEELRDLNTSQQLKRKVGQKNMN
jgi:hypothetical protein